MGHRRGGYATVFAVAGVVFIAFGAFLVDLSLIRLAEAEIQAVCDAAAHAGILRLRSTHDRSVADAAARRIIAANRVAGLTPRAQAVEFGMYENGAFTVNSNTANAVRVAVDVDITLPFASFWGLGTSIRAADATAAVRSLHTIVVMDITNSWGFTPFEGAREGAVTIFDQLTGTASDGDRIGMVTFHGQFGTEFTPLQPAELAVTNGVRDVWADMRTASKAGTPNSKGCKIDRATDFSEGECWPHMPREYKDETGTDHAIGIEMARQMFAEQQDPSVYRAMIVVTDGQPAGVGAHTLRDTLGHREERWRYTYTGARRGSSEVTSESIALSKKVWQEQEVHTWLVSYRANGSWMRDVAQGDGYFVLAKNSSDLDDIFRDIAESLPITLVE
ncbi:MAG: VWA domain-containing protein [Myxococcota bacterium]